MKKDTSTPFPSPETVQAVRNMFAKTKEEAKAIRESAPAKRPRKITFEPCAFYRRNGAWVVLR